MTRLAIILILLIGGVAHAQVFEDSFADGDFSTNPSWSGADSNFVVFDLNGNNVLRLNDNEAATSYLSTASTGIEGFWEFFVRIDGDPPSGSNKAEIILMSDQADLTGAYNGYGVRVGQTGDDVFHVVRYDAGTEAAIVVSDTTIFRDGGEYRIKVTRDGTGNWSIEVAEGYNGELKDSGNSGNDNTYTNSAFLGVKVTYTSTRRDDFYFDFKIDPPIIIIDPLSVDAFLLSSNSEIDLTFSRDIDFGTAPASNFILNGSINPQNVINQESNEVRLSFADEFPGGENQLLITGIRSSNNDTVLSDTTFIFTIFDEFVEGDVLINEFLKDPVTGSGIPEYVEIVNTSSKFLNLKDWQVGDNSSLFSISDTNFVLHPDTFLVLTTNPQDLQNVFGAVNAQDVSLPTLNNTTDQIRLRDASGNTVDSLEYTPEWNGVDVAIERRSLSVSSTLRANWGDSPNVQSGTPGKENEIEPDTTPPTIGSYTFENDSLLRVVFSESVVQSAAEEESNFLVDSQPGNTFAPPAIEQVAFFAEDTVRISFDAPFNGDSDGENYEVTIQNQQDIFGNVSAELTIDLEFFEYDVADSGEVALNEFMYDPADGYSEFVELYNHTDKNFDLAGWTFNDNSGSRKTITEAQYILQAGSYVILVPDSTIPENFGISNFLRVSGFPSLNNTTDDLVLRNAEGVLIDSLTYSSSWGGDEVSLERRSVDFPAILQANWGDSPVEDFATPGSQNQIEQDTTPPDLETFEILNDSTFRLIFTEEIKPGPASNPENYFISVPVSSKLTAEGENEFVKASFFAPDTVILEFAEPYYTGSNPNELVIQNQEDVFGNVASSIQRSYELIATNEPEPGDLAINEIMYDPPSGFSEFIEVNLHVEKVFNLKGWTISDNSGNDVVITEEDFFIANANISFNRGIPWNQHVILVPDNTINELAERTINMQGRFPTLNNSTDAIVLKDPNGVVIDSLTYFSSWGGDEVSLERRSPELPSTWRENWGDSPSENLATPAQLNAIGLDESPPEIEEFILLSDRRIQLVFDETIQDTSAIKPGNYGLSNPQLASPLLIRPTAIEFAEPDTVRLSFEEPFFEFNLLETFNQTDVFGNISEQSFINFEYVVTQPALAGEVKITEFAYDAPEGFSEFVEIHNPTTKNFDLTGWTFSDNSGSRKTITLASFFLKAGEYAILAPDSTIFESFGALKLLDVPSFPALNNSTDDLVLRNASGLLMDSLTYSSDWGGDEVSLERRSLDVSGIYRENWGR
jgi:hypothetical protein